MRTLQKWIQKLNGSHQGVISKYVIQTGFKIAAILVKTMPTRHLTDYVEIVPEVIAHCHTHLFSSTSFINLVAEGKGCRANEWTTSDLGKEL